MLEIDLVRTTFEDFSCVFEVLDPIHLSDCNCLDECTSNIYVLNLELVAMNTILRQIKFEREIHKNYFAKELFTIRLLAAVPRSFVPRMPILTRILRIS